MRSEEGEEIERKRVEKVAEEVEGLVKGRGGEGKEEDTRT